jgi:DNA polymerase-3 subunit alpha
VKNWTNLHNHTIFSTLDGHGRIDEYFDRAKSLGMAGLATTDHGNIHSWLDFYDAGMAHGVKPILGTEFYQARKTRFDKDPEERAGAARNEWEQRGPDHLTVLAKNIQGYKNIIKLSSRSFLEGYYVKPRIDHNLIEDHSDGLIVLSGCLNSEVSQALLRGDFDFALRSAKKMQDIVGKENYFIEVQDHGLSEQRYVFNSLLKIAELIGAKVVATGDCHYVHKSDARFHDIMLCVGTASTLQNEDRFSFHGDKFYLQSYDEMESQFDPQWLSNTMLVNEMVDLNLKFGDLYFPSFPIPTAESSIEYFDRLAWAGLHERYGSPLPQNIIERAEYEIRVIKEMGFTEYFLVVSDIVQWAKDNDITVGWGRGSAAGSIISYAFKITNLDPIKFNLMFERFLIEGRKSPPDIDLDFDDRHRDSVINYARQKYGSDHVAHICTFNRVGARQAVRDAARVLGYEFSDGDAISKLIPPPVLGISKNIKECMGIEEFKISYDKSDKTKEIVDAAIGLEGSIRQTGIHAAGVVISRGEITDYVPVMQKGEDNPIITQWDMGRVEQCGLLKIDFLGLRNLGVIDACIKLVKKRRGIDIDMDTISLTDSVTFDELCKGNSVGVFQLESPSMRNMMVALQPRSIEDIMALISLHRPGPMGSGMDKLYIDRKHNRSKIKYDHPKLEGILSASLGIMLYQEDILQVARHLAGFTAAEADDLRKAIGKKQMDKIGKIRTAFVKGCKDFSNVDEALGNKIFSDIEYFGGYGFNMAHAASYAMVSYVTAYLKSNYTVEYMAALMSSIDKLDKRSLYLSDCRKLGIEVLPPSINKSVVDFDVIDDSSIVFGLSAIDGIGVSIAESVVEARDDTQPYRNIFDFLRRCGPNVLKKTTLETFIMAGVFDDLVDPDDGYISRLKELSILEKEKDCLGIYVSSHPVTGIWNSLSEKIDCEIADISIFNSGEMIKIGGILTEVKPFMTKKGQKMFKLMLEDISSDIEIIVFPKEAKKLSDDYFNKGDIIIANGYLSNEGDEENQVYKLIFVSSEKIDTSLLNTSKSEFYKVSKDNSVLFLDKIYDIINSHPGDIPILIEVDEDKQKVLYQFARNTSHAGKILIDDIFKLENLYVESVSIS